ncbi:MAG: DNA-binding protein [Frankiales bacterium]|nr:DNA-binding protein [Frankiales bacterium]
MSGRIRRAVARLTEGNDEVADRALRGELASTGATPVAQCCKGEPVRVAGTLRAVTLRPLAGVPTLEAELYDGTGSIRLIWLGRRRIGGIECGRSLVAFGRLTMHDGRPTLYNAEYELRPAVV